MLACAVSFLFYLPEERQYIIPKKTYTTDGIRKPVSQLRSGIYLEQSPFGVIFTRKRAAAIENGAEISVIKMK